MADWLPLGDRAIRFARPAGPTPRALVAAIREWPDVTDVVVGSQDVAVYFERATAIEGAKASRSIDPARLAALASAMSEPGPVRDIELHAIYDGPDLDAVASAVQLSTAEIRALHAGATYTVETMGFAPGFAYMTGLDPRLELPRRPEPRPRVPAGSIAIARLHTAVYPFDSPGGWHLLGRITGAPMFGPDGPLLQLGDRVRFVP